VTAAAEDIPPALIQQLGEGGIMVVPLGPHDGAQHLVKITKSPGGTVDREKLIAVRFVPLLPGQAQEL
jgi:protein-L-isoaspartate(D-aspartate) O-methyltransferase